jgi:hypothetical protein
MRNILPPSSYFPFTMHLIFIKPAFSYHLFNVTRSRGGRDRMVVGFTTTYAISAYHHWCCKACFTVYTFGQYIIKVMFYIRLISSLSLYTIKLGTWCTKIHRFWMIDFSLHVTIIQASKITGTTCRRIAYVHNSDTLATLGT